MLTTVLLLTAIATASPTTTLEIDVAGARNTKGVIQACLMRDKDRFPDCGHDPRAIRKTVSAASPRLIFENVPPGDYAVVLFHDENANNRLDTLFGIPKEGFGFSRNPVVRFGPPRYDKVNVQLGPGLQRVHVRLQYLL